LKPAIWVASAFWSSASKWARNAASRGRLSQVTLDARVISVGNVQAGGTGKTPVTAQIAREAIARGLSVCILSRGYLSDWERDGGVIAPMSVDTKPVDANFCGDEPALLHELVPEAWIAVGADRIKQFEVAKSRFGRAFDLVILDDGFQHWKIKKNLEVVAMTSAKMGEKYFRDWPSAVAQANLVVWTKGDLMPDACGQPLCKVRYHVSAPSGACWLICGVADSESVVQSIQSSNPKAEIRRRIFLEDHAVYEKTKAVRWILEAKREGCQLVMTGKDWVKWQSFGISKSDVVVLEPELVFESGRENWDRVLWG
jgi:tetraacyldisaccharide 4'-kinase